MKLQLNADQITSMGAALRAAMAKDSLSSGHLAGCTRAGLQTLADFGHDPFTSRDLKSVMVEAGITIDSENDQNLVSNTMYAHASSVKKGYYTFGAGITRSSKQDTTVDDTQEAPAPIGLKIISPKGVSYRPPNPADVASNSEGHYTTDEALRQLAVANTPCFGTWSSQDKACGSCPLAQWCCASRLASLGDLANALDAQTEKDLEAAKVRAANGGQAPKPKAKNAEDLTDEELQQLAEQAGEAFGVVGMKMKSIFTTLCSCCEEELLEGHSAIHLANVGVVHVHCTQKLLEDPKAVAEMKSRVSP